MDTLQSHLQQLFSSIIQDLFSNKGIDLSSFLPSEITSSTQESFGHYQCNSALKLAKAFKKNPREIAQKIVDALDAEEVEKAELAGPGFINITFTSEFLSSRLEKAQKDKRLGLPKLKDRKKIIVEFSSPNIAKELHVGHLRSTIIGECLARFFTFLGHDVLRLNHVGDFGTQFGMLIAYLKKYEADVISGKRKVAIDELMQWYKDSKILFDKDPDFKKEAHSEVIALQASAPDSVKAWEKICDISREAFQKIYDLLDVTIQERGESYYSDMLPSVIENLEKKNLIQVSNGAKCVFLDGYVQKNGDPLPLIAQKNDGGYNYATTDLAAITQRAQIEKADRVICVVDAGQSLHFQMVFEVAEKAGLFDPKKSKFEHVAFGVVLGANGKKFKTREGKTEKLIDLCMEAVSRAKNILQEKMENVSDKELEDYATILGIDAMKYADLSCQRIKDYTFSFDRMLQFEGNTASFLLYSYVRILGIFKKSDIDVSSIASSLTVSHPSEITLGLHLLRFGEIIEQMDRDLLPNRLCDYLYQLAEKFNAFFRDCHVVGSKEEESRLLLIDFAKNILAKGLYILGLKTLPRM